MSMHMRNRWAGPVRAVVGSGLLLASTAAFAATAAGGGELRERYLQERAACERLSADQDRRACLRDAGAAYIEARRGSLQAGEPQDYAANALRRCEALRGTDRDDCIARMRGAGTVSGSVEGGGIYREYIVTEVGEPPQPATVPQRPPALQPPAQQPPMQRPPMQRPPMQPSQPPMQQPPMQQPPMQPAPMQPPAQQR